jgi:tetratricopeptide (TPR) repeat protein
VPRQLPADLTTFIGRQTELDQLDNLAAQTHNPRTGPAITTIDGMGGIGKTTLAVHWAHQAADRYPDGQLYVNLRGFDPAGRAMPAGDAVRGFLDALGVPTHRIPADLPTQAALYRSLLARRRMLILLDNAHHADQVRPLLPASPTCLVLITSRNTLTGLIAVEGAHPITLDLLTAGEARQLLAARLGPNRIAAEPRAADAIITACARLPLALAIAAARAATHPTFPLTALAAELGQAPAVLDTLTGPDTAANLPAVFSWSYHTLSPPAARLFRLLGLHPGPDISAAATASLAGLPPAEAAPLLAELAHANLLTEPAPGRYTLHDLLRAYAADQAHRTDPPTQRHFATHRMLDHYLHTGHAAAHLLNPSRDPISLTPPRPGTSPQQLTSHAQAMAWFTAEHRVLLAAVDHAAATGLHTHTWQLAWALLTYLNRQAHWHDLVATYRTALAATQQLADPAIEPRIHRILGHAYTRLGSFDDAHQHLRTSLDLATRAGDPTGQAHTHLTHSVIWERQNRHRQALEHAEQALRLYQAAGHQVGQARALNQIGWCHAHLNDYRQALTACQHALTLHQKLDNLDGQAATWDSLGYIHHHLSHHTQAVACYHNSLHLLRQMSDRYREADTLTRLGDTQHATGNTHAAYKAWQHALTILTDLDHPDAEQVRVKLQQHSTAECVLPAPRAHARHE